jgi:hypothetical protein
MGTLRSADVCLDARAFARKSLSEIVAHLASGGER